MSQSKKGNSILNFAIRSRYLHLAFIIFIGVWAVVYFTNKPTAHDLTSNLNELGWWAEWFDPLIGMGIFITTIWIGYIELRQDWEESLEKRLTVVFKYKERKILTCEKAYLTSEADIRALGQQIGAQMAHVWLDFEANTIKIQKEEILLNPTTNQYYAHYTVEYRLRRLPIIDKRTKPEDIKHIQRFEKENLLWLSPEEQLNTTKDIWKPNISITI